MFPFGLLACGGLVDDRLERFREAWAELLVVGDLQPVVERLVREPAVTVVGVRASAVGVGDEPQAFVEECAWPRAKRIGTARHASTNMEEC